MRSKTLHSGLLNLCKIQSGHLFKTLLEMWFNNKNGRTLLHVSRCYGILAARESGPILSRMPALGLNGVVLRRSPCTSVCSVHTCACVCVLPPEIIITRCAGCHYEPDCPASLPRLRDCSRLITCLRLMMLLRWQLLSGLWTRTYCSWPRTRPGRSLLKFCVRRSHFPDVFQRGVTI